MERDKKSLRNKILMGGATISLLSLFSMAYSQDGAATVALLTQIRDFTRDTAKFTNSILSKVNELPEYLKKIVEMCESWLDTEDESKSIAVNKILIGLLKDSINQDKQNQINNSISATKTFFGTEQSPINANDLSYTVLLGTPYQESKNPDLQTWSKNYINTVSGSAISIPQPVGTWQNGTEAQQDYYNLYNAIAAVQSFNNYTVSRVMAEQQKKMKSPPGGILNKPEGTPLSTQDILSLTVDQASSSQWFDQIASESLGLVLRQMLVFNAQTYVMLKQMVDYQQQMVTSQAMANTLLMHANLGNARLLRQRAEGRIG